MHFIVCLVNLRSHSKRGRFRRTWGVWLHFERGRFMRSWVPVVAFWAGRFMTCAAVCGSISCGLRGGLLQHFAWGRLANPGSLWPFVERCVSLRIVAFFCDAHTLFGWRAICALRRQFGAESPQPPASHRTPPEPDPLRRKVLLAGAHCLRSHPSVRFFSNHAAGKTKSIVACSGLST